MINEGRLPPSTTEALTEAHGQTELQQDLHMDTYGKCVNPSNEANMDLHHSYQSWLGHLMSQPCRIVTAQFYLHMFNTFSFRALYNLLFMI